MWGRRSVRLRSAPEYVPVVFLTERHFSSCKPAVLRGADPTNDLWGFGLRLRVGFGQRRALARFSAQRAAFSPQLAGWDEVPAFPKAISPKRNWRLHKGCGHCEFLLWRPISVPV